jgi:hypothetical protein
MISFVLSAVAMTPFPLEVPRILFVNQMSTGLEQDYEFLCVSIGYPIPDIQWLHNNEPIEHSDRRSIHIFPRGAQQNNYAASTLTLLAVNESDSGNYTCRGSNTAGEDSMVSRLQVGNKVKRSIDDGVGPSQCDNTGEDLINAGV